jgi:tRNA nucleotidyltransferase (CCA-adding enzyme)
LHFENARRRSLEAAPVNGAASTARRWEHFEHAADMGVRGIGATREAAFEEAALALCAVITDPALVRPDILFEVDCHATNDEFLLVDWLNALISEMSAHRTIFSKFEVTMCDGRLHGRAWGEAAVPARHHPAVEVKGATLTELEVFQNADGVWTAQCVVDV